jgi:IS5 family transposase
MGRILDELVRLKASDRAKVEHPFHIIKNLFSLRKVRYRGLAKNTARLYTLFGLANLVIAGRKLGATHTRIAS